MQRLGIVVVVLGLLALGLWLSLSSSPSAAPGPTLAVSPLSSSSGPAVGVARPSSDHGAPKGGAAERTNGEHPVAPKGVANGEDDRAADLRRAMAEPTLQALAAAFAAAERAAHATPPEVAAEAFPVSREGIRTAMRSAVPAMKACFEAWLAVNPDVGGRVAVTFRIAADAPPSEDVENHEDVDDDGASNGPPLAGEAGVADAVVAGGGLGNVLLDGCILNAVGDLRFTGVPAGGLKVTYPFQFTSDAPAPPADGADVDATDADATTD